MKYIYFFCVKAQPQRNVIEEIKRLNEVNKIKKLNVIYVKTLTLEIMVESMFLKFRLGSQSHHAASGKYTVLLFPI